MLLSRILYIILILFVFTYYFFIDDSVAIVLIILTFLSFLLLLLNILFIKNKLRISIQTTGTVNKNEEGLIKLHVVNRSFLPVSKARLLIALENTLTGEEFEQVINLSLNAKEEELFPIQLSSQLCGAVKIKIKSITYYDFLGIFQRKSQVEEVDTLYVLPNSYPIELVLEEEDGMITEDVFIQANRKGDNGLEIFGIREYEPGDSVKHVHWNLTSKFNELIVKELTEEVSFNFLLAIDLTSFFKESLQDQVPYMIDSLVEATVSVSEAILKKGYGHAITWLDPSDNILHFEMVYSDEDLHLLMKKLLNISQIESDNSLFDYLMISEEVKQYSHVLYFSNEIANQQQAGQDLPLQVKYILCRPEEEELPNTIDTIYFNPGKIEEQLNILSI